MAGIRNRGGSGFSTCSAARCTATVSYKRPVILSRIVEKRLLQS